MKLKSNYSSRALCGAVLLAAMALAGCSTSGAYRCPLDSTEEPDSVTACAGMPEALAGAQRGTGGKESVLLDDKGALVPVAVVKGREAMFTPKPGTGSGPVHAPSMQPVYEQPAVFQVWTGAYVDASGNLHDGRHSWFATPGRWAYGNGAPAGSPVAQGSDSREAGSRLMGPARPDDLPEGRILAQKGAPVLKDAQSQAVRQAPNVAPNTPLQSPAGTTPANKQDSLKSLSKAADSLNKVTTPKVGLND